MDRTDAAADAPTADQTRPEADPRGARPTLAPYLVVALLGLIAALIVVAQLWAYRDELRTLLTS